MNANQPAIRQGREEDLPAILALAAQEPTLPHWSPQDFHAAIDQNKPQRTLLVAEVGDIVIGFVVLTAVAEEAEIEMLAVARKVRRHGIGRALIQAAARCAIASRAASIHLEVRQSNVAAQAAYTSVGFNLSGYRRNYYRDPCEDAVLMYLTLDSVSERL